MLEGLSSVLARIAEIKSNFTNYGSGGVVDVTPHSAAGPAAVRSGSVKPFFPEYLLQATQLQANAASVGSNSDYDEMINQAAEKYNIDASLVKAVIQAESGFNPHATSSAGAQGLMQLMPSTSRALGVSDPFDAAQNIDGGTRYLKQQIDRYGDVDLALAAYNAGPGSVAKYNGIPPYRETQNYVAKVLSCADKY